MKATLHPTVETSYGVEILILATANVILRRTYRPTLHAQS